MIVLPNPKPSHPMTTEETIAWLKSNTKTTASGCMEWLGSRNPLGYGSVSINRKRHGVHRLMLQLCSGPIGPGMHTDHLCRNPPCCNPDHLEAVTPKENVRRGTQLRYRDDKCFACGSQKITETVDTFSCGDCGAVRDRVSLAKKMKQAKEQRVRREQLKTMSKEEVSAYWKQKHHYEKWKKMYDAFRARNDLAPEPARTRG